MNLHTRISNLEATPPPARPMSDRVVLDAMADGSLNDAHVAWLDPLFRPAIQTMLCTMGLSYRLKGAIAADVPAVCGAGVEYAIRLFVSRGDEPGPFEIEQHFRQPAYSISASEGGGLFEGLQGTPHLIPLNHGWLRYRLLGNALGPDLGRSFRLALDQAADDPDPGHLPYDSRRPHRAVEDRLTMFTQALHPILDFPLIIESDIWDAIEAHAEQTTNRR